MKQWISFLFILFAVHIWGQSCKSVPQFIRDLGYEVSRSAIKSGERRLLGAQLIEYKDIKNPGLGIARSYNHPSWASVGFAGAITRDHLGHTYVLSTPMVNNTLNPDGYHKNLFRIDAQSGIMEHFVELPVEGGPNIQNIFGQLGMHFDCATKHLIVSHVSGSTRENELGKICTIDVVSKEVSPIIENTDAMGICIIQEKGQSVLLYGSTRESKIYAQRLTADLKVDGQPQLAIDLEGLGPRWDDRARKIVWDQRQRLLKVYGVPFFYNLTSPTEKRETLYIFARSQSTGAWELVEVY